MMRPVNDLPLVYVYKQPVDMRKAINGLSVMVEGILALNPFSGHLFVFGNRKRDKVKILYWQRNGFCLWYKRLERDRFKWPACAEHLSACVHAQAGADRPAHLTGDVLNLTGQELNWLLGGLDISRINGHKTLHYSTVL